MSTNTERQQILRALGDFFERRLKFYAEKDIFDLLRKDVLLFALKGATNSESFVSEAFAALESSSEEGAMGDAWQQIATELSGGLESGDLTLKREDTLWVMEIKSQTNTFSGAARLQTLRTLKVKRDGQRRVRRARHTDVHAAIGIIRGKSRDDWITHPVDPTDAVNQDLKGFNYRYLVGEPFWIWLAGRPNLLAVISDVPELATEIKKLETARNASKAQMLTELRTLLRSNSLPDDMPSIMLLADRHHSGVLRRKRRVPKK